MYGVNRKDTIGDDQWPSEAWPRNVRWAESIHHARSLTKGVDMKNLIGLVVLALCLSAPSFGAEHIVSRSAKFVGKESYKATKVSAEDTGKAGLAVLKFVF
jgi:hypothetical protein